MALLPGYKVSNSTVWLGRAPAAKLPLAACASLWPMASLPLAAWQGYLGTSVGFLFDLFGCQGCLGGGFSKGRDRAVWVPLLGIFLTCLGACLVYPLAATCLGFLVEPVWVAYERGEAVEGLLLTRLGASLVYRLAAWQGYLGTSVGFFLTWAVCGGCQGWLGLCRVCFLTCLGCLRSGRGRGRVSF